MNHDNIDNKEEIVYCVSTFKIGFFGIMNKFHLEGAYHQNLSEDLAIFEYTTALQWRYARFYGYAALLFNIVYVLIIMWHLKY